MAHCDLQTLADLLARTLCETNVKIVFAESCTAGLVAASLASVPGISQWLCGSAVVYREQTKAQWLNIEQELLRKYSAVSSQVTSALAIEILRQTDEAELAVAVTGHLGPAAPETMDGLIYVSSLTRNEQSGQPTTNLFRLASVDRADRQREATAIVMQAAIERLRSLV